LKFTLLLILLFVGSVAAKSEPDSTFLRADVSGLQNEVGTVFISLFRGPEGFPSDSNMVYVFAGSPAKQPVTRVVLGKYPSALYAMGAMHDENGNDRADTNFLGIPTEGVGTSGDVTIMFGPPSFDDAMFEATGDTMTIKIELKYF
jgi:uncharacterized protein (DUF2141 family)